jgi:hypothetical protein
MSSAFAWLWVGLLACVVAISSGELLFKLTVNVLSGSEGSIVSKAVLVLGAALGLYGVEGAYDGSA